MTSFRLVLTVSALGVTLSLAAAAPSRPFGRAAVQGVESGMWAIIPHPNGDLGMTFSLGWTLGIHQGRARSVTGSLQAQLSPLTIMQGEFRVPIAAMSTGSPTVDCHMREALGIDYTRSHFPAEHVCVNDQMPTAGPDAVAFPEIVIRTRELRPAQSDVRRTPLSLPRGQMLDAQILLEFSIHGRSHEISAPARVQLTSPDLVQVETEFDLKFGDFGVVVKMPPFLRVDDHAKVKLLLLIGRRSVRTEERQGNRPEQPAN